MKKRYGHEIAGWDLAQKNERSLSLGKIAESYFDAYMDIDELTKHMIIAGSTGSGKTVAGQVVIEEALSKKVAVVVIDPTCQWTGFLKELEDEAMKKRNAMFNMKKDRVKIPVTIINLNANTTVKEAKSYLNNGELTIFTANLLTEAELDIFIHKFVTSFFSNVPNESQELKVLLVFEEIHRILPKYGGTGAGFLAIERGVREFRKWGIGIILISQVLEDFRGEIRANIGTEIQMRTSYEVDLGKITTKYGDPIAKAVVRAETGTGLFHNSAYNIGQPYFVMFRPITHSIQRLSEKELNHYEQLSQKIQDMEPKVSEDDYNLKLAKEKLKTGNLKAVEMFLEGLQQ